MIPVLGIPVIADPGLLRECVASIDAPLERLVIIDNSPDGGMTAIASGSVRQVVASVVEIRPPTNLGFSGSLNHFIRTHADRPWWMFANADAVFAPGDMARVAENMERADGPFLCGIRDFRLFGINAAMIETVGFWDENFHPMYCEDTDYQRRMTLSGIARYLMLDGQTGHVGSATIRDPHYSSRNQATYPLNRLYYSEKWGGDIGRETFTTPFDRGGHIGDWRLSLERLKEQAW